MTYRLIPNQIRKGAKQSKQGTVLFVIQHKAKFIEIENSGGPGLPRSIRFEGFDLATSVKQELRDCVEKGHVHLSITGNWFQNVLKIRWKFLTRRNLHKPESALCAL